MSCTTVLLDVEGAVSPAAYTRGTLLEYARRCLPGFLGDRHGDAEVRRAIHLLARERRAAAIGPAPVRAEGPAPEILKENIAYCNGLMVPNRSSAASQMITELIWRDGLLSGELCSEVFADVPLAFQRCRRLSRTIATYSSSSAAFQELFFRFSEWGDLTPYIGFYFDGRVGPKNAALSYQRIVGELHCLPKEVLFVSDTVEDLDAAYTTGIATALAVRNNSASVEGVRHWVISDLNDLVLE